MQNRRIVVHQQSGDWIERLNLLQARPEFRLFLDQPQIVGADQRVKMAGQLGFFHLQRQTVRVGIGDENDALAGVAQRIEKSQDMGMDRDQMGDFTLDRHNVQGQFLTPVIEAIPVERPFNRLGTGFDLSLSLGQRQTMPFGVAPRDQFPPEVVVKSQIQQGAVHIQQHGLNLRPG